MMLSQKKYMESHVSTSHIQSSNRNNVFKYIMDDPAGELTEEDDIKLGDIVTYQSSPHQINNKRHAMHAEAMTFHKGSLIIFGTFVKKLGYIKVTDNFCAE